MSEIVKKIANSNKILKELLSNEYDISKYPLYWTEILGSIFHDIQYKYKDKCLYELPVINTTNYI